MKNDVDSVSLSCSKALQTSCCYLSLLFDYKWLSIFLIIIITTTIIRSMHINSRYSNYNNRTEVNTSMCVYSLRSQETSARANSKWNHLFPFFYAQINSFFIDEIKKKLPWRRKKDTHRLSNIFISWRWIEFDRITISTVVCCQFPRKIFFLWLLNRNNVIIHQAFA